MSMNILHFMKQDAAGNLVQYFPCRCGEEHGPEEEGIAKMHSCFHSTLTVIDTTPDGSFIVACPECETGWVAKCEMAGTFVKQVGSWSDKGCNVCRDVVMMELLKEPEKLDYTCAECKYHWKLTGHRAEPHA